MEASVFPPRQGGVVELIIAKVGKVRRCDAQEISHNMDEDVINDSFPYLKELENKIGRKTPESLLVWMRDAEEWEDFGGSGEGGELSSGLGDSFSEKISTLKQELVNVPSGFDTSGRFVLRQSPVVLQLLGIVTTCTTRFHHHTCVYSENALPPVHKSIQSIQVHLLILTS